MTGSASEHRHAVIAGANKCGTTSLFRYLASHPSICASRIKETGFFATAAADEPDARARYERCFEPGAGHSLCLEATPGYLRGGGTVARRMRRVIPGARLVFLLREPVDRMISYLRVNRENLYKPEVASLDCDTYVSMVEAAASGSVPRDPGPHRNAALQFERGCYARFLVEFLDILGNREVLTAFFDELQSNPGELTRRVSVFLGVDASYFDDFRFSIENRTRQHRSRALQRQIVELNRVLEPWLNRVPSLRARLRGLYEVVNERRNDGRSRWTLDEPLRRRLAAVYEPHNRALAELLSQRYPELSLPAWLASAGVTSAR